MVLSEIMMVKEEKERLQTKSFKVETYSVLLLSGHALGGSSRFVQEVLPQLSQSTVEEGYIEGKEEEVQKEGRGTLLLSCTVYFLVPIKGEERGRNKKKAEAAGEERTKRRLIMLMIMLERRYDY